ncbi:hypothetical protein BDW62DRAFT_185882 [Aspergillus aurantiobrunneus]
MHLSSITLTLLLTPLALTNATPNLATGNNAAILKRSPIPMKPLAGRGMAQSSAHHLARSPQEDVICASGEQRCGNECVDEDYTCCPDNANGGCPSDEECREYNGRWGCCPDGEECRWEQDDDVDDDSFLDRVGDTVSDIGDDIEEGWNDITGDDDDVAGMLKPAVGVALMAAVVAAVLPF